MTTTDTPLHLLRAAGEVAGGQQYPAGALYVVATPIGNLADLSLRAIHVLALADAVACEDTRVTAGLLRRLGLSPPLLALHAHNERAAAGAVLGRLARGERVALVSDAGTPAISDPGALLVALARGAGYRCVPIPGPSSATAALSVAGDAAAAPWTFVGFLPTRGGERRRALAALAERPGAQVLFEAPHRIAALAAALAEACGQRRVTVARELSKQFESIDTMPAAELPAWLAADANRERGEFVLVLHAAEVPTPSAGGAADAAAQDGTLVPLLEALPLAQAVALAARITGASRKALYARALALRPGSR